MRISLVITLLSALMLLDNIRFNSRVIKPDYRYFDDPNEYVEITK